MKTKIFLAILLFLFLLGVGFYLLPYNYQWRIAQWPLAVGEEIEDDFGEVIIVPGAGCNPGRGTEERLNLASSLYQIKRRKVIISEGYCFPNHKKLFTNRMMSRWKIDTNDVIWDTLSFNTEENILHTSEMSKELGFTSAILCSSPHHQLRCRVLMNKYWEGEFKIAQMSDSMLECNKEQVYMNNRGNILKQEYLKIVYQFLIL